MSAQKQSTACSAPASGKPDDARVHPALKEYFVYCLNKLTIRMKRRINLALQKKDLCGLRFGILTVLSKIPEYNQLTLGEELGIDKATMVKLIDQLEKAALVARIPHATDRRQKLIQLTRKGTETLGKAKKIAMELEAEFMSAISPEEQAMLRKVIPTLLEHLMKLDGCETI